MQFNLRRKLKNISSVVGDSTRDHPPTARPLWRFICSLKRNQPIVILEFNTFYCFCCDSRMQLKSDYYSTIRKNSFCVNANAENRPLAAAIKFSSAKQKRKRSHAIQSLAKCKYIKILGGIVSFLQCYCKTHAMLYETKSIR